jgi:uncharacterized membrane protein YdjX (TVP38/TMEM64 family)
MPTFEWLLEAGVQAAAAILMMLALQAALPIPGETRREGGRS